jgi:50S ribosomal subunit-associated GTPase HflX
VIDITDESRFTSCQREFTALRQVLRQQQQQLQGQGQTVKPILIYLNKIDLLTAVESQNASIDTKNIRSNSKSVQFISRQQKLKQLLRLNMAEEKVHWKIQPCSTHTGEGILDGFRWLTSQVLHY